MNIVPFFLSIPPDDPHAVLIYSVIRSVVLHGYMVLLAMLIYFAFRRHKHQWQEYRPLLLCMVWVPVLGYYLYHILTMRLTSAAAVAADLWIWVWVIWPLMALAVIAAGVFMLRNMRWRRSWGLAAYIFFCLLFFYLAIQPLYQGYHYYVDMLGHFKEHAGNAGSAARASS